MRTAKHYKDKHWGLSKSWPASRTINWTHKLVHGLRSINSLVSLPRFSNHNTWLKFWDRYILLINHHEGNSISYRFCSLSFGFFFGLSLWPQPASRYLCSHQWPQGWWYISWTDETYNFQYNLCCYLIIHFFPTLCLYVCVFL